MVKWKFPDNSTGIVNIILIIQIAAVLLFLKGRDVSISYHIKLTYLPRVLESSKTVYAQVPDRQWRQLDDLKRNWRNVHKEALTKSFCIENAKTGLLKMVT